MTRYQTAGHHIAGHHKASGERTRRFQDAALPCLDDAYRLAYFLLRNRTDAENAVEECYRRALHHFEGRRGGAVRPWLLSILRSVCYAQFARLAEQETPAEPGSEIPDHGEGTAIRQLVYWLPAPLREAMVMREFNDMSYREIADVVGVPPGTVMSRLAQARELLLTRWQPSDKPA
ncbi:sigma-70 family RNA polymerase sigma factor [Mesorhizobium loti]|uniref:Sigma-70 family RNA polymerase sigma factor n=1 Tax=Mesorhizobium loti R88b TaxID=935548 RepID=A0A6M7WR05_RHILI|nr:sigma-70 family RNA polymerase sigma factor [Mesorhizobium loti]QKD02424.1 sigma-70 family RNA polymerase sigma factor [Mesorhizobium loti R88b]